MALTPAEKAAKLAEQEALKQKYGIKPRTTFLPVEFVSTGSLYADLVLEGGLRKGQATILWGPEGYGKTRLVSSVMALITQNGGRVAYFDTEKRFDRVRAVKNGVDLDFVDFFPDHPLRDGEWMIETLKDILAGPEKERGVKSKFKPLYELVVWDSLAATPWESSIKAEVGKRQFAIGASMWTSQLNSGNLLGYIENAGIPVLFIDQARANMDADKAKYFPVILPGARAWKHAATTIIRFDEPLALKKDGKKEGEDIGLTLRFTVQKNSPGPARRKCEINMRIDYSTQESWFDTVSECVDVAQKLGVFTNKAGVPTKDKLSRYFNGVQIGGSEQEMKDNLQTSDELYREVYTAILGVISERQQRLLNLEPIDNPLADTFGEDTIVALDIEQNMEAE